jgi:hypothetical protein
LTSSELGWAPENYTHHVVNVGGLASPSDTWALTVRLHGSSVYGSIGAAAQRDGDIVTVGPDYKIDAFKITFSAPPTSAYVVVGSLTRKAFIEI